MLMPATLVSATFLMGVLTASAALVFWLKLGETTSTAEAGPKAGSSTDGAEPSAAEGEGDDDDHDSEDDAVPDYVLLTPDQVDAKALDAGLVQCDCSDVRGCDGSAASSRVGAMD